MTERTKNIKKIVISTLFILAVTFLIGLLPVKTEFPKLIKSEVEDYDVYDLHFAGRHLDEQAVKRMEKDTSIVLIQLADTRGAIADQLQLLAKYHPAVIGVDALFRSASSDSLGDLTLSMAQARIPNIIWASKMEVDTNTKKVRLQHSYFEDPDARQREAYGNFIGEDLASVRVFSPFVEIEDTQRFSFTAKILQQYRPDQFKKLERRDHHEEAINYTGNLELFPHFTKDDLYLYDSTDQLEGKLEGKVVLLGFFKTEAPLILQDLHYTPLNEHVAGKSLPDMYGVVIHANILRMMLEEKYITRVPGIYSYLISGLLVAGFLWLEWYFARRKGKHPSFLFHLGEVILLMLLVYLFLVIFSATFYKFYLFPIIFSFIVKGFHETLMKKCLVIWEWLREKTLKFWPKPSRQKKVKRS